MNIRYRWVIKKLFFRPYGKAHLINQHEEGYTLVARCGYTILSKEKDQDINNRWFYMSEEYKPIRFCKHCAKAFERFKILDELRI